MTVQTARPFQFQLAPDQLWQAINPWNWNLEGSQFGFINVTLGETKHPEVERAVLEELGSYGRQLGHIGEALEVLIDHFHDKDLTQQEKDALSILKGDLAKVREIKVREMERT